MKFGLKPNTWTISIYRDTGRRCCSATVVHYRLVKVEGLHREHNRSVDILLCGIVDDVFCFDKVRHDLHIYLSAYRVFFFYEVYEVHPLMRKDRTGTCGVLVLSQRRPLSRTPRPGPKHATFFVRFHFTAYSFVATEIYQAQTVSE